MNFRKTLLILSVAAAAAPAAFANDFVGGEVGYATHPSEAAAVSRSQVRDEYLAFRQHPVLADGTVALTGEAGYVSPNQGSFADSQPAAPHTHVVANASTAQRVAAPMTPAERHAYEEQYIN